MFSGSEPLVWWLVASSVVMFVASLMIVPWMIVWIPPDYFAHRRRHPAPWKDQHPVVRAILFGLKNLLGALFIILGVLLLVLPGQGLLTILVGIVLLDFPGKYRLERYIITRGPVLRSINWLRERKGHPPLKTVRK
jgi:hypothetical protein